MRRASDREHTQRADPRLADWRALFRERAPNMPILPHVMEALCAFAGFTTSLAYRVEPHRLEFCFTAGAMAAPRADLEAQANAALAQTDRVALYNPYCPEPNQRNKARYIPVLEHRETNPAFYRISERVIGKELNQLRVLLCDGPVLLAWVGGFAPGADLRHRAALLQRMGEPLRRRLAVERRLGADARAAALDVLLDRFPGRALLVGPSGEIAHANGPARASLAKSTALRALAKQNVEAPAAPLAGFERLAVPGAGAPAHVLLLELPSEEDIIEARAQELALTPRQVTVLRLMARGYANKETAQALRVSVATVEFHVSRLLRRFGVDSRAQILASLARPARK